MSMASMLGSQWGAPPTRRDEGGFCKAAPGAAGRGLHLWLGPKAGPEPGRSMTSLLCLLGPALGLERKRVTSPCQD